MMSPKEKNESFWNGWGKGAVATGLIVFLITGIVVAMARPYAKLPGRVTEAEHRIDQNCAEIENMKIYNDKLDQNIMIIQQDIKEILKEVR